MDGWMDGWMDKRVYALVRGMYGMQCRVGMRLMWSMHVSGYAEQVVCGAGGMQGRWYAG